MNYTQFRLLVMLQIATIFLLCVLLVPQLLNKKNTPTDALREQIHDPLPDIQDNDLYFYGDSNAINKLYVFSSYDCGYCQDFYCETFTFLQKNYVQKGAVKIAFVPNGDLKERKELFYNKISEIAKKEKKYEEIQNELYCSKHLKDSADIIKLLLMKGVDEEGLKSMLSSDELTLMLYKKRANSLKYNVQSNPTFLLNGHMLVGYNGRGDFLMFFNKYLIN